MELKSLRVPGAMVFTLILLLLWRRYLNSQTKTLQQIPTQQGANTEVNLLFLPNEILLYIFERVPVFCLISQIPLTFTQFAQLSEIVRHRLRCLTLIFGNENLWLGFRYQEWPASPLNVEEFCPLDRYLKTTFRKPQSALCTLNFKITTLNRNNSENIIKLFPNVRALQLSTNGLTVAQLDEAINETFLTKWSNQLEALHLIATFEENKIEYFQTFSLALVIVPVIKNWARIVGSLASHNEASKRTVQIIRQMPNLHRLVLTLTCQLGTFTLPRQLQEMCLYSLDHKRYRFKRMVDD